jgi:hypothetical protein
MSRNKKSIREEIRSRISHRILPVSIVDLDKLAVVLTDHEKRIRALERFLNFSEPVPTENNNTKSKQNKKSSKKKNKL